VRVPFTIPEGTERTCDVVTLGLNSVDLVALVEAYPGRNSKQGLKAFTKLPGGQMATAAAVCARLGWRARYVGAYGDDDLGALARAALEREGVDLSGAHTAAGATNQFAVVIVDGSGDRTVLWHRHPALALDPTRVPRHIVCSGRLLIVDCHETPAAIVAARAARGAGAVTIIDVERVRPRITELLGQIDAIIAAEGFPRELTGVGDPGAALEAMAREFPASLITVTLGEGGSLSRWQGTEIRTRAFKVDCVDTTGAGDAFRGGFAAGCLRAPAGQLEDVLTYANAVAALNCRALGAQGGMPTRDDVEQLLVAGVRA
jgi:sugar/nucleoside kinase (ribokinase family)